MAPKKKEHTNDLRTLVIRHNQDGDLLSEIAAKTLLSRATVQYLADKYKSTKCIAHLFRFGRKKETSATTDQPVQRRLNARSMKISFHGQG